MSASRLAYEAKELKRFEEWWAKEIGGKMKGSKYLALKAWFASAITDRKGGDDR